MDFLTQHQLTKYEKILNEIQSEHEQSEILQKQIELEENRIIISQLPKFGNLCNINVKIFSGIVEVINLYSDEIKGDIYNLINIENCKFYLMEIYIPSALEKHLQHLNWFLSICITNGLKSLYKNIYIHKFTNPIIKVIPVDEIIICSDISVILNTHMGDKHYSVPLNSLKIDISYHFETNNVFKHKPNKHKRILQIAKNYNTTFDIADMQKPVTISYRFITKFSGKEFAKHFIQNCYHNVDISVLSDLGNDSNDMFSLKFFTGYHKHCITLDRACNVMHLQSNTADLTLLKTYFCTEVLVDVNNINCLKQKLKDMMLTARNCMDKDELQMLYLKLRKFWIESRH